MSNLTDLTTRILQTLGDPTGARYPAEQTGEALRRALEEYSRALPELLAETITVAAPGRSQPLGGARRLYICEVYYPYDPSASWPVPLDSFYSYNREGRSWLYLGGPGLPAAGEQILVHYAAAHTIQGLDGASLTSVPGEDEGLLVEGAAGMAAVMRAAGLLQAYGKRNPQDESAAQGAAMLASFRRRLKERRTPRSGGRPWLARWKMDGWDNGSRW